MKLAQLCRTLCDPLDTVVHGILQVRILDWLAVPLEDPPNVGTYSLLFWTVQFPHNEILQPSTWKRCYQPNLSLPSVLSKANLLTSGCSEEVQHLLKGAKQGI